MNQIHYTFFKKKHYLILYFPCYVYNMLWILHNSEFTYLKYNDFLFRRLIYRRATGTLQNTRTLKKPLCKSVLFFQWYFLILRSQYLSVISGLMCLRVFHLWLVFWIQSAIGWYAWTQAAPGKDLDWSIIQCCLCLLFSKIKSLSSCAQEHESLHI